MNDIQQYCDWKKELQIWGVTNTILQVDKRIQAGILYESLKGIPRQIVLSELSVSEITDENGVENMIRMLDAYFIGNETNNSFNAIDELFQYKREQDLSIQDFIVKFQLKANKVKSSGTILSDGVLGYVLLNAANLPENKHALVKATCQEITYKLVKCQLEKIGFSKSSLGSSNENRNGKKVGYLHGVSVSSGKGMQAKPKLNPTDRLGNVRTCNFCKCLYHWFADCPYAPNESKSSLKSRKKPNNNKHLLYNSNYQKCGITLYTECDSTQLTKLIGETLGHAVVDTGCPCTVAGDEWLKSYINTLSRKDRLSIRTRNSNKNFCFGDGSTYQSKGSVFVPIYVGKRRYKLCMDVVDCNIPLLLSQETLRRVKAKIDVEMATICFLGNTVPLIISSTGHLCLSIGRSLDASNKETRKVLSRILFNSHYEGVGLNFRNKALKLHLQFFHPSAEQLMELLKKAGAKDQCIFDAIEEVTLKCDVCIKSKRPRLRPAVDFPSSRSSNGVVAGDLSSDEEDYFTSDEGEYSGNVDTKYNNVVATTPKHTRLDDQVMNIEESRSWTCVATTKDLPKVHTTVERKFPRHDSSVRCKILSRTGKCITTNWHFMDNTEGGGRAGNCCSYKDVRWRPVVGYNSERTETRL